jgi:hypothetical protein
VCCRYSGSNSGAITPTKSETGGDEDYEAQRERAKLVAAAAAAEEQAELAEQQVKAAGTGVEVGVWGGGGKQ